MVIKMKIDSYVDKINDRLFELLKRTPAGLGEAMMYSVFAGGKRLRPCMLLSTLEMLGGTVDETALDFACAIEMIHTYSLIHDDLPCMDNDDMRRGKPSNHKFFGEATAVLAGDGLLSYAFEIMLLASRADDRSIEAMREIARGAGVFGMVEGQMADMNNEKNPSPDEFIIEYIDKHKTGALISAAVLAGARLAGVRPAQASVADKEKYQKAQTFSELYGLLFQITDDILDVVGDEAKVGKTLGKDQKSNKLTYVALLGLDGARALAQSTAKAALDALEGFGKGAEPLVELTKNTQCRAN